MTSTLAFWKSKIKTRGVSGGTYTLWLRLGEWNVFFYSYVHTCGCKQNYVTVMSFIARSFKVKQIIAYVASRQAHPLPSWMKNSECAPASSVTSVLSACFVILRNLFHRDICTVDARIQWSLGSADKSLARTDWKNNSKVAIFRPTRRSLLPRRPCWTENLLIYFLSGLQKFRVWSL